MRIRKPVLSLLQSRIVNTPLLIRPEKLETILGIIGERIGLEENEVDISALAGQAGSKNRSAAITSQDIAVIPIYGTLAYRTQGLQSLSGLTSYNSVRDSFREAMANPGAAAILLDIDSPGGETAGLFDLVDEIYSARGTKPIYAYANESAFSAAYGIASAADEIIIPRTGGVGSIGVVTVHVDVSKADEKAGYKYTPIYSGARKIDFYRHRPLSDQARDAIQKESDRIYDIFTATIARNRKVRMSLRQIKDTEAGIYMGEEAVEIGLADHVMSWDAAIEYIMQQQTKNKKGGAPMNSEQAIEQIKAILDHDEVEAEKVMSSFGYISQNDMEKTLEEAKIAAGEEAAEKASKEAVDRYAAQVKEAVDLCLLADMPGMIKEVLETEMSIEDIRKKIMDAKAKASVEIRSTIMPASEESPLVRNARMRAEREV